MATVKSLTSMPGLEGSLLRCQGHIGRSDRQRETEGVVSFHLLEARMPPYAGFAPFISHHNKFVFFTLRHFHERETERERVLSLEWVPVYRYT